MHDRRFDKPFAQKPPLYPFHDRYLKDRFLQLVRDYLGRDGKAVLIRHGMAHVAGSPMVHGLSNLAQLCNQASSALWPDIIATHLAKSDDSRCAAMVGQLLDEDFEQQASKLVVRIQPKDYVGDLLRHHIVHRFDLPETCSVLALDIGPSIVPVPTPVAEQWARPLPELFERALQNLPLLGKPRWSRLPVPPGVTVDLLHDDFHAPSYALRPDTFAGRTGKFGNLVGLPSRGVLLSYTIDTMPSMWTIEALLAMTTGRYQDGPGSITPHLFWRTPEAHFHLQQGSNDGGRIRFVPSPEFVELLVRLQKARPQEGGG